MGKVAKHKTPLKRRTAHRHGAALARQGYASRTRADEPFVDHVTIDTEYGDRTLPFTGRITHDQVEALRVIVAAYWEADMLHVLRRFQHDEKAMKPAELIEALMYELDEERIDVRPELKARNVGSAEQVFPTLNLASALGGLRSLSDPATHDGEQSIPSTTGRSPQLKTSLSI